MCEDTNYITVNPGQGWQTLDGNLKIENNGKVSIKAIIFVDSEDEENDAGN